MKKNLNISTGFIALLGCIILCAGTLSTAEAAVRINEFSASNSTYKDSSGQASDWIELFNDSNESIDLGGCYLTDTPNELTRWQFPNPTTMSANSYLVVFADSTTTPPIAGRELHTSFSLSKTGEYLALVDKDGTTILSEYAPEYPEQYSDISFGINQDVNYLIGEDTSYEWSIPSASGTSSSGTGKGAIGFTETEGNGGFTVSYYELRNSSINNTSEAETYIKNRRYWKTDRTYPVVSTYETINFDDGTSAGHFTPSNPFPTQTAGQDKDYFILVMESNILIPEAGQWTFGGMSDDGFNLRITGNNVDFVCEYPDARSMSDTLGTFNFPQAGIYHLRAIFFEAAGGAGIELYACKGNYGSFNNRMRLIGDTANGGLATQGAIAGSITTDIQKQMKGVNSRLDTAYRFNLNSAPSRSAVVTLEMRYADGYTASLNGFQIASENVPDDLTWDSTATKTRTTEETLVWQKIQISSSYLKEGENVLKVTGLNNSKSDPEFFLQAQMTLLDEKEASYRYFTAPTPGQVNGKGYLARTPIVQFSHERGYCDNAFVLEMTCDEEDAQIRYTLDGSTPSETNGSAYTAPITISKTTVLRAISYKPSHIPSEVQTRTWIFLDDVFTQSSTPPTGWPSSGSVNGHTMYYGMNKNVTESNLYRDRLREGFKDIQTISLVTDLPNLFNAQTGIYVNPGNSGESWERPVSVELIDPQGGEEFFINAGLRIRGAASRTSGNPKHSFRLLFRGKYGESKLQFPLFGKEGVSEFDKIDLRTEQNHSWHREDPATYTAVREVFSRDTQKESGVPYSRSRYYHLFLNGLYWGLYMTEERISADYAVTYLGGNQEDWDCIKTESSSDRATVAGDGNMDAWRSLYDISMSGYSGIRATNYYKVRGLNPDGTRNPNYPVLLDQDNLIKFMINAYYTGDPDNPYSLFGNFPNNLFALYNRANPDGFKWFRHDAEHSLAANRGDWGLNMDYTAAGWNRTAYSQFEPMMLHLKLIDNPEYKMRFADIVQEEFFNDGILTPQKNIDRYKARMDQIDRAVIGESARWGARMGTLRTRDVDWIKENNYMLETYFPQRTDIVLSQFKNRGWYPNIAAPASTLPSGMCDSGEKATLSASVPFYYTLDGTDPRLPGGNISSSAILVSSSGSGDDTPQAVTLIPRKSTWKYFDQGSEPASINGVNWKSVSYNDNSWSTGAGCFGFGSRSDLSTQTTRTTSNGTFVNTTYFRQRFTLDSTKGITGLKISLNRDDGAIVYLNGTEILRDNMPSGDVDFSTFSADVVSSTTDSTYFDFTVSADKLRTGANVIAVEIHQCNGSSSDMYFDMELGTITNAPQTGSYSTTLNIDENTVVYMRTYRNGSWSALSKFTYLVRQNYEDLRVSELMFSPSLNEGDTGTYDDYAWLEICNTGEQPVNMQGVKFTEGITYTFPSVVIPPNGYLVLAKNADMFATRYDTNGMILVDNYDGNLARKGETLTLVDPEDTLIQSFTYDRSWYRDEVDRTGYSMEIVNLSAPLNTWDHPYNWYPSAILGGTPGYASALYPNGADQIASPGDSVEFILDVPEGNVENIQWLQFNTKGKWKVLEGENSATLILNKVSEKNAGLYMAKFDLDGVLTLSTPNELMILLEQPADVECLEGENASLSVGITAIIPDKLQWQKFTSAEQWEDILNGFGSTLELIYVSGGDTGLYRVRLGDQWVSEEAKLDVVTETIPPTIVKTEIVEGTYIRVTFSEYVTLESALNPANYKIQEGILISSVVADGPGIPGATLAVMLETVDIKYGFVYTLVVNNVCDVSYNHNKIEDNTTSYVQAVPQGQGLLRQVWYDCSENLTTMTGKNTYPNYPDLTSTLTEFASPIDWGDYYGQKLSGFIIPPVTGDYTFWICSDDYSELWLSTDQTTRRKKRIAYLYGWAPVGSWETSGTQKSVSISLTANKPYYIEGLQTDGSGGDHIIVRWQLPDGTIEEPIPQSRLYLPDTEFDPPVIKVQPKSVSCYEGDDAVFEPFVQSSTPVTYAWKINGEVDPAQTNRVLTLRNVTMADNGTQVSCTISNIGGVRSTRAVSLTILPPKQGVTIESQPVGSTIEPGESYILYVGASGTAPLSYQWYRNGTPVGTDSAFLTVTEAGFYKVEVTNPLNSVTSDEVEVIVQSEPTEPPALSILRGTSDGIVVQFEGTLQAASTANGEWTTIATESPARIVPTETMKFFRAVR